MQADKMKLKRFIVLIVFTQLFYSLSAQISYSESFYAAQKYFYQAAKQKNPKIKSDRSLPEVPIRGLIKDEELSKIEALQDYFEARRIFIEEVSKYPEQMYPEIFKFLNNHPALKQNPGNTAKQKALEFYFSAFFSLFSSDKHYSFEQDIRQNPCPLLFTFSDLKKNSLSFKISNTSKTTYELLLNEFPKLGYVTLNGKMPIKVKAGSSAAIKCNVDVSKLSNDSSFKTINIILHDPTQPKVKIIIPVILLPGKEFLNPLTHVYDLNFNYSTFFKHISLQKEKSSWPEACPNGDCSGKINYTFNSSNRLYKSYHFNEFSTIQFNLNSKPTSSLNLRTNTYQLNFHELGNLAGEERNCVDSKTGEEVHCPADAPNNGKELYGQRKIEWKLLVAGGSEADLHLEILYADLANQAEQNSQLSWLQEKKLVLVLSDVNGKQIYKQVLNRSKSEHHILKLASGTYLIELFPMTEDGKLKPSFTIQHLNHGGLSRFDFNLDAKIVLQNRKLVTSKK